MKLYGAIIYESRYSGFGIPIFVFSGKYYEARWSNETITAFQRVSIDQENCIPYTGIKPIHGRIGKKPIYAFYYAPANALLCDYRKNLSLEIQKYVTCDTILEPTREVMREFVSQSNDEEIEETSMFLFKRIRQFARLIKDSKAMIPVIMRVPSVLAELTVALIEKMNSEYRQ